MTTAPAVGSKVHAITTTQAQQSVVIEVTAIHDETEAGWYVYGYRAHRGTRPRQTMYPRLYFVARIAALNEAAGLRSGDTTGEQQQ
jgi:hypothetical protein